LLLPEELLLLANKHKRIVEGTLEVGHLGAVCTLKCGDLLRRSATSQPRSGVQRLCSVVEFALMGMVMVMLRRTMMFARVLVMVVCTVLVYTVVACTAVVRSMVVMLRLTTSTCAVMVMMIVMVVGATSTGTTRRAKVLQGHWQRTFPPIE
jgi:hypothetical protein